MDDFGIIALFNSRDEGAVEAVREKYGMLLKKLAKNTLHSEEDTEEAVSDALMGLWQGIPPAQPENLRAYSCRAVRNAAAKILERNLAAKRDINAEVPLEELSRDLENVPAAQEIGELEFKLLTEKFLDMIGKEQRVIFVKRYFFFDSIPEIAADMRLKEAKVRSALFRLRKKFKEYIERSGI